MREPGMKPLLKQLAEERRRSRPPELEERNRKIIKMIELGCSYEDVGRRYGLTVGGVRNVIRRKHNGRGIAKMFSGVNDTSRACFVDGIG